MPGRMRLRAGSGSTATLGRASSSDSSSSTAFPPVPKTSQRVPSGSISSSLSLSCPETSFCFLRRCFPRAISTFGSFSCFCFLRCIQYATPAAERTTNPAAPAEAPVMMVCVSSGGPSSGGACGLGGGGDGAGGGEGGGEGAAGGGGGSRSAMYTATRQKLPTMGAKPVTARVPTSSCVATGSRSHTEFARRYTATVAIRPWLAGARASSTAKDIVSSSPSTRTVPGLDPPMKGHAWKTPLVLTRRSPAAAAASGGRTSMLAKRATPAAMADSSSHTREATRPSPWPETAKAALTDGVAAAAPSLSPASSATAAISRLAAEKRCASSVPGRSAAAAARTRYPVYDSKRCIAAWSRPPPAAHMLSAAATRFEIVVVAHAPPTADITSCPGCAARMLVMVTSSACSSASAVIRIGSATSGATAHSVCASEAPSRGACLATTSIAATTSPCCFAMLTKPEQLGTGAPEPVPNSVAYAIATCETVVRSPTPSAGSSSSWIITCAAACST
mmetsp:Transcript_7045/g.23362  ORF Transcript_7045/g.23362 Transcript_7045/m.23362 type:complete len:505 (-) Transcript_7045:3905-5419(-)